MTFARYEESKRIVTEIHKNKDRLRNIDSLHKYYENELYVAAEGGYAVDIPKELAEGLLASLRAYYTLEAEKLKKQFKEV